MGTATQAITEMIIEMALEVNNPKVYPERHASWVTLNPTFCSSIPSVSFPECWSFFNTIKTCKPAFIFARFVASMLPLSFLWGDIPTTQWFRFKVYRLGSTQISRGYQCFKSLDLCCRFSCEISRGKCSLQVIPSSHSVHINHLATKK